jgi:hypothetical protein
MRSGIGTSDMPLATVGLPSWLVTSKQVTRFSYFRIPLRLVLARAGIEDYASPAEELFISNLAHLGQL